MEKQKESLSYLALAIGETKRVIIISS
jgi:hypothetical protein